MTHYNHKSPSWFAFVFAVVFVALGTLICCITAFENLHEDDHNDINVPSLVSVAAAERCDEKEPTSYIYLLNHGKVFTSYEIWGKLYEHRNRYTIYFQDVNGEEIRWQGSYLHTTKPLNLSTTMQAYKPVKCDSEEKPEQE